MKTLLLLLLTLNLYAQPEVVFRGNLYQQTVKDCSVKATTVSVLGEDIIFTFDTSVEVYKNCIRAVSANNEPSYLCADQCGSNYSVRFSASGEGVLIKVENHLDGKKNYILSSANICN